jgi:hypothetical protein
MKKQKFLAHASILLLATLMIFSSGAALANTNQKQPTLSITDTGPTSPHSTNSAVVWDNGIGYQVGLLAAQLYPGDIDAFPADDFQFNATYEVNSVFWQGGYYNCQYASGGKDYNFPWNITFFTHNATGNKPGAVYKTYSFQNASITRQFWYTTNTSTNWRANFTVTLSPPVKFQPNTKYWMTIYAYNATFPQTGWCRHSEAVGGIRLHEGMFKSTSFGFPDWVNVSTPTLLGAPHDFNYQLMGTQVISPDINIEDFKGGFGHISAVISNTGEGAATNVNWTISLTGGHIFLGKITTGLIPSIPANSSVTIKTGFIFGFGKINIVASETCTEASNYIENGTATVLLFFVLNVQEPPALK